MKRNFNNFINTNGGEKTAILDEFILENKEIVENKIFTRYYILKSYSTIVTRNGKNFL